MKKLLIILSFLVGSIVGNEQTLTITNNTCGLVKITLFGHNPTYPNCMDLQVKLLLPLFSGGVFSNPNPFNAGQCWINPNYPASTTGTAFVLDAIKFEADDDNGCIEYGAVGGCGGLPTTFLGSCQFCGGSALNVSWASTGSSITINFN